MISRLFESPEWLPWAGAGVALLAAALAVRTWRDARRRRALLGEAASQASLLADLALVAAAAAIAVALCGPLLGERRVRVDDEGMDVVLLVDASRSMDARDTPPSRLRRAKQTATELLAALPAADRVGLVAFGGAGRRLAPLTPDRDALARLLGRIDTQTALPHGSSLEAALATALDTFELDAERRRVIVLLSDGELPRDGPARLARLAERSGVHVHAALFGRDVGATIPFQGALVIGPDGEPALTRREHARVSALAEATGGEVLLADRWGRVPITELARAVRGEHLPSSDGAVYELRRAPTTAPFAVAAFALLLAEPALRGWRGPARSTGRGTLWPAPSRLAHTRAPAARDRRRTVSVALVALVLGLGAADPGERGRHDHDELRDLAADLLRQGARAIERGDDDAALQAFRGAAATALRPDLAGTAHYQIGVWYLKHDDPVGARDAFLESLRLEPGRLDAVFNLEWSLLAIEAREATERDPHRPLVPREPDAPETDEVRDETSKAREPDDAASPEFPRGQAPERSPSSQVRPQRGGIEAPGPNPETGADGRPLLDPEALSWWLDLVEDEPTRAQVPDRVRGHGSKRSGPPW